MKNFRQVSSLLLSTIIISGTAFGFADKYDGANGEDYSVQNNKTYIQDRKTSDEVEFQASEISNLDSINSSNNESRIKQEEIEKFKDILFKYSENYKKNQQEIDESRDALKNIRTLETDKYSVEQLEKIKNTSEFLKNNYNDITVLSFLDIVIKDKSVAFDTPPLIKNDRTLIPLRAIVEAFDAEVLWDNESREASVTKDGNRIIIKPNEKTAIVNGREISLDVSLDVYADRIYVPIRFIAENIGIVVDWDNDLRIIKVEERKDTIKDNSYNVM